MPTDVQHSHPPARSGEVQPDGATTRPAKRPTPLLAALWAQLADEVPAGTGVGRHAVELNRPGQIHAAALVNTRRKPHPWTRRWTR